MFTAKYCMFLLLKAELSELNGVQSIDKWCLKILVKKFDNRTVHFPHMVDSGVWYRSILKNLTEFNRIAKWYLKILVKQFENWTVPFSYMVDSGIWYRSISFRPIDGVRLFWDEENSNWTFCKWTEWNN